MKKFITLIICIMMVASCVHIAHSLTVAELMSLKADTFSAVG